MLELKNISKKLGGFALHDIFLNVTNGEYFVLLGESGAGKTMLLEIIAGLSKADKGSIVFNGQEISAVRANKRGIGLVFQDNAIFPHLNVEKNIAYSLHGKGFTKSEILSRVLKWAETMNIENLLNRKTSGLSGGELRRVALARTLAMEPAILLLDEPLSSLDILIQYDMIRLLKNLNKGGQTIIHVTHDFNEAYSLADTLAIINAGTIEQTGPPPEVFKNPASRFVSALAGIRNFFTCVDLKSNVEQHCLLIGEGFQLFSSEPCPPGCSFFIREDEIEIQQNNYEKGNNVFDGVITDIIPSPDFFSVAVNAEVTFCLRIKKEDIKNPAIYIGSNVQIKIPLKAIVPVIKK